MGVAAAIFAMLSAVTSQAQQAALGEISVASDADDFELLRLRTGALLDYASPFDYAGLAIQTTQYTRSGWRRDAPAALMVWRKQDRTTLAGTIGELGIKRVAGRTRLIGEATWSLRPSPRTGIELLAASDLVETQAALERATTYTFAGVSAEHQWTPRLSAVGLTAYQKFSDGNERTHLRGRLIWLLLPEQGLSAQLRLRQYESNQLDVDGAYFNPGRYREWQAGLGMRRRSGDWAWSGSAMAGRETINGEPGHATMLIDVRAEGRLRGEIRLVMHGSYVRGAGLASGDDGYWYRVVGVNVIVPF